MPDSHHSVTTASGAMDVFVTMPDNASGKPLPVVVQLMDGLGMREELRDHARRVAAWGYCVVCPDLFHRFGLKGPLDFNVAAERDKVMAAITALDDESATADVKAALALLDGDDRVDASRIGLYGFCMGGKLTLVLAKTLGSRVVAGASIHPGGLVTDQPQSPHQGLEQVSAEMYFGIADKDASATPEQMAELETALSAHRVSYQLEWHTGALHGFMMPSRADLYHEAAAEKTWERIRALFGRTLG